MSLSVDCSGSSCDVSGTTDRTDQDATMVVSNDLGIHGVDQLSTSGGSFSTALNVSNLNDGTYTIEVNQGSSSKYNLSVSIDVSGGSSSSSDSVSNQVHAAADEATAGEAEAEVRGLLLSAGGVEGSTTIDVSVSTDRTGDVTLTVTAPNGNIVAVSQITPSGGGFDTTIEVGGPLWSQDGDYTISAHQGDSSLYQASAEVEVVDGHVIPEFGVIAAMILAIAIVSIIVVTAKTRLSIVPRY
jgi:predicted secreted protein with PEFG-CTERM motif